MENFKFLIPDESSGITVKNISRLRKIEEHLMNSTPKSRVQKKVLLKKTINLT